MAQANKLMPGEWDNVFGPSVEDAQKTSDIAFETKTRANAGLDSVGRDYNSRVNMGRQIGQGINKLFGGKSTDPALRRAETMDRIFKTLSPEELKNPANALSIIADRLEEDGLPRDAAEARMQSIQLAQQQQLNENTVKDSNSKREVATLEKIARGANGILTSWDTQSPELQEQFYNIQVNMIAKELGEEAAAPYRNVKPSERKGILQGMVEQADNGAARSKEEIAQNRIVADQQRLEMKLEQDKTKFILSEANKFKRDMMKYRQQDKVEYTRNLSKTVNSLVDRLKIEQDNLEMYNDASKSPLLSEALRITNKNITNANILQIKKEIQEIGSMQMSVGERVYSPAESPTEWAAGTKTTTAPGATTASTTSASNKTEYEADYINAQAALQRPGANKQAILDTFKAKYSDKPQPTAATVTPTPGATPVANPAAPAEVVPPKPQTEAERREQIFLERLNDRTPLEVIQDVGSSIAGGIRSGEKYFQDKADTFNKNIDIAASVAKEKLKDKTFVSKLSERQLKHLNEIANDSGAKHRTIQQSQTPFELPFVASSYVASVTVPAALKGASRVAAAKAIKEAIRTPSDIETSMTGLQDRLKRVEELERARKLKQIGDSDKEVLRQIKEEVKLMDQANETALKESLKNAETTAQRKLAMEQRKRLADIRKEIKRVFSIAGGTPVPYKKPDFDGGQVPYTKPLFN